MVKILRLTLIVLLCFLSGVLYAQENPPAEETEEIQLLTISQVSEKIEESYNSITRFDNDQKLSKNLSDLYESIPAINDSLKIAFDSMNVEFFDAMSLQMLENHKNELNKYQDYINGLKSTVSDRLDKLQQNVVALGKIKKDWNEIAEDHQDEEVVSALLNTRLQPLIDSLESVVSKYKTAQTNELEYFSILEGLLSIIKQKIELLGTKEAELREDLVQEFLPIWQLDSVQRDSLNFWGDMKANLEERRVLGERYFEFNAHFLLVLFILVIAFGLFFIMLKNRAIPIFERSGFENLGRFFQKPVASAFVISFLFMGLIYKDVPQIIVELILISLIIPVAFLLHGFLNYWQKIVLYVYALLFTILIFLELLNVAFFEIRLFTLLYQVVVFVCTVIHLNKINIFISEIRVRNVTKLFSVIFMVTAFASIIYNVFGAVKLSMLLINGTIYSFGIGIVLSLWYHMLRSFALLLLNLPGISHLKVVSANPRRAEYYLFQIIGIILFWEFLISVTNQFDVTVLIRETWSEWVNKEYIFGKVSIKFGDFINSFIVLIVAILLARVLKHIIGSEILSRFRMKRGVPNAVSTTVYYLALTIGFFLAASSTGIDWSEVNLAIGAIGVGIGFGLQNVIYNFISGLILIYERPVQVGDVVEVGALMGTVKEIGIRSSKLLTYEGSEVIVPNGNLISNEVVNWTYTDQIRRWELIIKTDYSAQPQEVIDLMKSVILESENIIPEPEPMILFTGYGNGTLDFRILFWASVDVGLRTRSMAAVNIYKSLQAKGFKMPMQTQAIVVESNQEIEQQLPSPAPKTKTKKVKDENNGKQDEK